MTRPVSRVLRVQVGAIAMALAVLLHAWLDAAPQNPPQTGTPPQTGATTEGTPVDREELLRHVSAIEALLTAAEPPASATTGTTGTTATGTTTSTSATQSSVTLTPAQVDQLRNHLNELKRLLNER